MMIKRKSPEDIASSGLLLKKWRPPTLPHCIAVPSAQAGLTSLFGMGRGGTPTISTSNDWDEELLQHLNVWPEVRSPMVNDQWTERSESVRAISSARL